MKINFLQQILHFIILFKFLYFFCYKFVFNKYYNFMEIVELQFFRVI
ncbi:hypothetical protein CHAB381_0733 [Campylobacter hominis ATCC BAA-381]|uniref:Uncharacterized protein n=1 Tax=Campylobacter hominis (strain ATCC BAA-381 / DSM 21671 / CCUG 45161 / LMG 19568 / NCTC 13146 / CH001A) TaxID=360107 RepID=A7I1C2_CAMHC|nr:hypothetical protein CHAB381_0733 [Campylobacter hominis ATCC BAA-381]